jgi:hypothetical protein
MIPRFLKKTSMFFMNCKGINYKKDFISESLKKVFKK